MAFHAELMTQLRVDLAHALNLPAEAIYVGDRAQKVQRQGLEVWIEPVPEELVVEAGFSEHTYRVHLRLRSRRQQSQTGASPVSHVLERALELTDRYSGRRPFAVALPSLKAIQADQASLGTDDEERDVLDASVSFRFLEA